MQNEIKEKFDRLKDILRKLEKVSIAFSGGVDSTFLLKAARDVLGAENVLAVTALSETTPRHEKEDADHFARVFGIEHMVIRTRELDIRDFVRNPSDKCYICKKSRFEILSQFAGEHGFTNVADGENMDDGLDFRPGSRAARELGVRSPLREAGMTKSDIRVLSKEFGLATWDKPSYACLASRIPYHQEITAEKLKQIDDAEIFLRELGLSPQLRVRHHGDIARIELDRSDFDKISDKNLRSQIVEHLRSLGFQYVTLDLEGYGMGSLNRAVEKQQSQEKTFMALAKGRKKNG